MFTVAKSSSPAKLPAAAATTKSIEFGFRGSSTLTDNKLVRGVNDGWLVHMNDFQGVKSAKAGRKVIALLRAGKQRQARPYVTISLLTLRTATKNHPARAPRPNPLAAGRA
jgi:hypothetical protein